jgi:hypothetical protein
MNNDHLMGAVPLPEQGLVRSVPVGHQESRNSAMSPMENDDHVEKNTTEARQGVTLHAMRYVLGISLALVIALMLVAYFATR